MPGEENVRISWTRVAVSRTAVIVVVKNSSAKALCPLFGY